MGVDQAAALKSVEGRMDCPLLDVQHVARDLPHAFGEGPTVLWTEGNCSVDEQFQRPLWRVDMLRQKYASPFHFYK
jgi:hypothetical protein